MPEGGLEVAEQGRFIREVVDGLRVVGGSREVGRRERDGDGDRGGGTGGGIGEEDEDEEML